jgi:uncharacterized protein (DUF58 family)
MTWRITRASLSTLTLVSLALVLGVVSGRAELMLVSVPLALRLLAAARRPEAPRYRLLHELSTPRLFEGETATVTVSLIAETPLPQAEALEPLPPSAEAVSGHSRTVRALAAGETARWSYDLRLPERGRFTLGTVHLRLWEPSGLVVREVVHRDPKTLHVFPQAAPLSRLPAPLRTQVSAGNYVSPLVGDGIERAGHGARSATIASSVPSSVGVNRCRMRLGELTRARSQVRALLRPQERRPHQSGLKERTGITLNPMSRRRR